MSRNVSLLGCFNDRDQKMRKMAKNTALRLAQKQKESTTATVISTSSTTGNQRGKTTGTGPSQSLYAKNRVANSTGNSGTGSNTANTSISQQGEMVKFPKVTNSSNKNIEIAKKPDSNVYRITNSRDRGRIQV